MWITKVIHITPIHSASTAGSSLRWLQQRKITVFTQEPASCCCSTHTNPAYFSFRDFGRTPPNISRKPSWASPTPHKNSALRQPASLPPSTSIGIPCASSWIPGPTAEQSSHSPEVTPSSAVAPEGSKSTTPPCPANMPSYVSPQQASPSQSSMANSSSTASALIQPPSPTRTRFLRVTRLCGLSWALSSDAAQRLCRTGLTFRCKHHRSSHGLGSSWR